MKQVRVAVLSTFNLDLLEKLLRRALGEIGLQAEFYFTGYALWEPQSLDRDSALYKFAPDTVIIFADAADLLPPLHPGDLLPRAGDATATGGAAWQRVRAVTAALLDGLPGQPTLLVHNLARPETNPLGTLEDNSGYSCGAAVAVFNEQLRELAEANPRVRVIDYLGFVMQHGWRTVADERLWTLARMRVSNAALNLLAAYYARYLGALFTPRRKCLVLDLDNTLWKGVLGEDGADGIGIGQDGIGLAFREFQLAILALAQRGVVLAIASKNNPEDVYEVFDNHPEMILRRRDFACLEIHWNPKSESLPRIAEKLNLGLDSFVFWDDEPREREVVRTQHPAVLVPEVPADPAMYSKFLLSLPCFDVLSLTEEDRQRGQMYRQEASRQEWLACAAPANLAEFYRSLEMVVSIERLDNFGVQRVAQLTQRTNQFNFTTRRYSEADIRAKLPDPSIDIYTISLEDRFGKLGVIGAAIVHRESPSGGDRGRWQLDTFLMSCRALGRGVEEALLATLVRQATDAGATLCGEFIPTKKNKPAREFLDRLQVRPEGGRDDRFSFQIAPDAVTMPTWIELRSQTIASGSAPLAGASRS